MNFLNAYLLLPLQRKIFKNFGHYDYQTSTFHLNEERVNEVFFDPAYNPFVDVLRETSHASAVASSKAAAAAVQRPQPQPHRRTVSLSGQGRSTLSDTDASLRSTPPPPSQLRGDSGGSEAAGVSAPEESGKLKGVNATAPRSLPVRLLRGRIRSAGLLSFLRRVMSEKSLKVESMDLVFDVNTAATTDTTEGSHPVATSQVVQPPDGLPDSEDDASLQQGLLFPDTLVAESSVVEDSEDVASALPLLLPSRLVRRDEVVTLARSYSIEDHSCLPHTMDDQGSSLDTAGAELGDAVIDNTSPTADGTTRPESFKENPATPFHTVGDLMTYLKQQLQGLTVGVEEVRLTFCVPPAGAAGSLVRHTDFSSSSSRPPTASQRANATGAPLFVRKGTFVMHLSCRRGLRFTVDESTGASVEDMQCTASIQDWQCYVHVMADDGPLPSEFSLEDLIFATPTTHTSATGGQSPGESAKGLRCSADDAPFTIRVARRGAEAVSKAPTLSASPPSMPVDAPLSPRMLITVDAAKGWSIVLSTVQVAHLVSIVRQVLADTTDSSEGMGSEGDTSRSPSPVKPAGTAADVAQHVVMTSLDSDKAVTAAALSATQMRTATKYVSVHCGGCSISLLTQSVEDTGAVARAWRSALSSQQLALLDPQSTESLQKSGASVDLPVYEILTTPHLTYVMRDVDILFPNIDAETPLSSLMSSPTASGIFQRSVKKRKIYRRIFDNKLADPAVTEQLREARCTARGSGVGCEERIFFIGIGSISFLEYRRANASCRQQSAEKSSLCSGTRSRDFPFLAPALSNSVRPARVMHAERSPYALVIFHRSTPPLREQKTAAAGPVLPPSPGFRIYQETVVVGLANISLQLDPGLLEVLAIYGTNVQELICRVGDRQQGGGGDVSSAAETLVGTTGFSSGKPSSPSAPSLSRVIRTCSSVKVLLESIDASIRYPVDANASPVPPDLSSHCVDGTSKASVPPAPTDPAPQSLLLSRLLQRLRESSLDTHRRNRTFIRRQARQANDDGDSVAPRSKQETSTVADGAALSSAIAVQHRLGFPEDMDVRARFLPEWLRFSLRDLQVVHTPSTTAAARGGGVAVSSAVGCTPANTAVKWREAVVYLQDILEETKSELFRVNYSHEMNINVTHTGLPSLAGGGWSALERVLALQVQLGEITTTALTQDDYLLATYYVNELLLALSRCRQRLHAGRVAAVARDLSSIVSPDNQDPVIATPAVPAECLPLSADPGTSLVDVSDENPSRKIPECVARPKESRAEPPENSTGSLEEAFSVADAQKFFSSGEATLNMRETNDNSANGSLGDRPQDTILQDMIGVTDSLKRAIPELWRLLDTTCTSLNLRIGRIRLGLFAPRLSPMGQVVGEPLYRCLPKAQRRCLVDLNCLYHLYIMVLVDVSVCGLSGDGALARAGKVNYVRFRLGGFYLWERQPECPPTPSDNREAAGAAALSSLYTSYVSNYGGPGGAPPESRGLGGGTSRDLAYYMSNSQIAHSGHRRYGTLVQLVQSYTEVRDTEERGSYSGYEDLNGGGSPSRGDQWTCGSSHLLSEVWCSYVRDLESIASSPKSSAHPHTPESGPATRQAGVCEVRFLEAAGVSPTAPTAGISCTAPLAPATSITAPGPTNSRHLWVQLTALGLHHNVAYSGDHLAAVLKQYFSGEDGTVTPAEFVVQDGGEARSATEDVSSPAAKEEVLWTTRVHVDVVNLMATYRPHGAGRSLAVLLLPRASVLVHIPSRGSVSSPEANARTMSPKGLQGSGAAMKSSVTSLPASASTDVSAPSTTRAWAWLHTPLSLYVCNDCDVETLVREVLEPAEGDDLGVDLQSAGFVRLCEVISTANSFSSSPAAADLWRGTDGSGASSTVYLNALSPTPNLLITVRPRGSSVSAFEADRGADTAVGASIDYAYLAPAVSVELQHIELSAFMAKDSFEVFRELVEAWGAGADLKATDTPAAFVMRSGPGFEWVAEEVERSCAPMTFRVNPHLLNRGKTAKASAGSEVSVPSPLGPPAMRSVASFDDHTSHYPLPLSTPLQASRALVSPWGVSDKSQLAVTARAGGISASFSALGSNASLYGYDHWLDALHVSHGRDPQLYGAYQKCVAQLLDGEPWVPVHRSADPAPSNADVSKLEGMRPSQRSTLQVPASAEVADHPQRSSEMVDIVSLPSDDDERELGIAAGDQALSPMPGVHGTSQMQSFVSPTPPLPRRSSTSKMSSMSSSFSDLEDTVTSGAQLQWHVLPSADLPAPRLSSSGDNRQGDNRAELNAVAGGAHGFGEAKIDMFAVAGRHPHFLSCWSRGHVQAARERRAVRLNRLDCTDDALLHNTAEKYLYPPVELEFFLSDCSINFSLYEGNDLMAAAVRKQRRGYLQIVSRGANLAQAAPNVFGGSELEEVPHVTSYTGGSADTGTINITEHTAAPAHAPSQLEDGWRQLSFPRCTHSTAQDTGATWTRRTDGIESSASRLQRLHDRGCHSGFGDRDANKRLVLSCREITVQVDTFPQASEEDLWFHVVIGEATVFDCIDTSDVHRLLTATPKPPASRVAYPRSGSMGGLCNASMSDPRPGCSSGANDERQLELTGLLSSSKGVRVAASGNMMEASRASFTVSHFQQGGSELALVIRLQPTSLTLSGASVDFAQSFFSSTSASPTPSSSDCAGAASAPLPSSYVPSADVGTISGTEAPPLFYRRVVILPTTVTAAGSFQSDKGVVAALSEGNAIDALRSIPVLSWISLQEIPLPIPFMRIEDCSTAAALLQRIVEDSNCISVRFLLTACCCGLQPLSAVTRVGEAAKDLFLLPLSNYRGAALHHSLRTASSVFMQELLTQTSGMAALLASGSYHASRSLLEALVPPQNRAFAIAEPSRASQPTGVADGWRQGQKQLRVGLQEAVTMASYCTGPDGSLLRVPAAALRLLMGVSGAATTTLWGVRNSQDSDMRERDGYIYKKKY